MNTKQHISPRLTEIKTKLANWEKWFGVKVYDQHKCAVSEKHVDTDILYVSSPESDSAPDGAMASSHKLMADSSNHTLLGWAWKAGD
jgi:hypothetical protein